jgi:sugar lactone lactonase YvrE
MAPLSPVVRTTDQTQLGEGTRWDDRHQELLHVDILTGRVFRHKINDDGALFPVQIHEVPGTVGAIAPIEDDVGWSPDSRTMYLADSSPGVIHAFAFDPEQGAISEDRLLVDVPEETGSPDGLTVDAAGDLWVAIYGGGRVQRYAPDGRLREELFVPAEQTTCCTFAGPGLHRLYVTTATENWTDERRRAEPGAGLVYMFETDATGQPAAPFRPDPTWWAAVIL